MKTDETGRRMGRKEKKEKEREGKIEIEKTWEG